MKTFTTPLAMFFALAMFAASCGSSADVNTAENGESETESSNADVDEPTTTNSFDCADVEQIPTTEAGTLGSNSNPDDRVMGVIHTYAEENLDVFAGIWIDRDNDGTIAVAFTDDPARHTEALNARGPLETDSVGVEPPPPITDARPLGERDDVVFEVVQARFTEAELRSIQNELSSTIANIEGAGLNGSGVLINYGVVELFLADPTNEALTEVEALAADQPVCLIVGRTPAPLDGPLDIIGASDDPAQIPAGLGQVTWSFDPDFPEPGPTDTELHVRATEIGCASGQPMGDRLQGPQVIESDDAIRIAFAVTLQVGGQDCQGNPSTPVTITLDEPLGDRTLIDAVDPARQPVMGEGFDDVVSDSETDE